MKNESKNVLYFIGIGGISMSSLAAIAKINGHTVYGSDRSDSSLISALKENGIEINIGQTKENIDALVNKYDPKNIRAIYSSAISESNPEILELKANNIPLVKRADFLGELMLSYKNRIGIAGTHGKSTTTAMISLILEKNDSNPTILEGAVMKEYNSAYKIGSRDFFVFEACEYCNSFHSFFPTASVITNVDFDHADFFKSIDDYVDSFKKYLSLSETAIVNYDSENCRKACVDYPKRLIRCSLTDAECDYFADNILFENGLPSFDIFHNGAFLCRINLSVPGKHNISNALVAAASCYENGADIDAIKEGLHSFAGIKRRMELIKNENGIRLYDDYAHHPEEIKASLSSAKSLNGRVICIFQPHSLSRTTSLFNEFVTSFSDADELILADIYENLEEDNGQIAVTSKDLASAINGSKYFGSLDDIAKYVNSIKKAGDIIITMGAGDIYKICNKL